jgi:hypothetical protein
MGHGLLGLDFVFYFSPSIVVAQDRGKWYAVMNTVMIPTRSIKCGDFMFEGPCIVKYMSIVV